MRARVVHWPIVLIVGACVGGAWAQEGGGQAGPAGLSGFWPTDRMIDLFIRRAALEMRQEYELTEEQTKQLEGQMLGRWPKWLKQNRTAMQPLLNEMIEARLGPTPPEAAFVADWASRALPLLADFQQVLDAGNEEFRGILTPRQQATFDAQRVVFAVGIQTTEQRLKRWQQGQFEASEWWQAPGQARGGRRATTQGREEFRPIDAWQAYVEQFIHQYQLDPSQTESARSILAEVRGRAEKYRDSTAEDLSTVERQLRGASGESRRSLTQRRGELRRPLVQLFEELKGRLEALLTAAQRPVVTSRAAGG